MRVFSVLFLGVLVLSCGSVRVEWLDTSSSGESAETTYEFVNENGQIQRGGEKVEYSDDGLTAVRTTYYSIDSLPVIIAAKSVCKYDNDGRLLSREAFDPDETDDIYPKLMVDTYKYTRSRVVRIESTKEYKDGAYQTTPSWKYKERYKNGKSTKMVIYKMENGKFRRYSVIKDDNLSIGDCPLGTVLFGTKKGQREPSPMAQNTQPILSIVVLSWDFGAPAPDFSRLLS